MDRIRCHTRKFLTKPELVLIVSWPPDDICMVVVQVRRCRFNFKQKFADVRTMKFEPTLQASPALTSVSLPCLSKMRTTSPRSANAGCEYSTIILGAWLEQDWLSSVAVLFWLRSLDREWNRITLAIEPGYLLAIKYRIIHHSSYSANRGNKVAWDPFIQALRTSWAVFTDNRRVNERSVVSDEYRGKVANVAPLNHNPTLRG